ncbi:hypothetical protein SprV_0501785000 [Sparganum proliferum]
MKEGLVAVVYVMFSLNLCSGDCLSCFVCNSSDNSGCLDKNFKEYSQSTLTQQLCMVENARFCIKTTALYGAIMGTTRFCSAMDMGNQCQYTSFPDHDRIYRACIFTCGTDGCNSAHSFFSQSSGPFASTVLLNTVFIYCT